MEKKNLFTHIHEMETQLGQLHSDLGELKMIVKELLEDNQRLTIENEQLRKLLKREAPVDRPFHLHWLQPLDLQVRLQVKMW